MLKEVHIECTLQCAMNCIHCSGNANSMFIHPRLETIKKRICFLKKLCNNNEIVDEIVITGGEPLNRVDLSKIVICAKDLSKKVSIFTSGVNRNVNLKNKWSLLKSNGLDVVVFSVHTLDKRIAKIIYGKDLLEDITNNIIAAMESGLKVEINCSILSLNYDSIPDTVRLLINKYKVDRVRLLRFVSQGRGSDNEAKLTVSNKSLDKLINLTICEFKEKIHFEGFPKILSCRPNSTSGAKCKFANGFLYVDVDGNLLPCPAVKQGRQYILGNIDEGLDTAELNEKLVGVRKFLKGEKDHFGCLSQVSWFECKSMHV